VSFHIGQMQLGFDTKRRPPLRKDSLLPRFRRHPTRVFAKLLTFVFS